MRTKQVLLLVVLILNSSVPLGLAVEEDRTISTKLIIDDMIMDFNSVNYNVEDDTWIEDNTCNITIANTTLMIGSARVHMTYDLETNYSTAYLYPNFSTVYIGDTYYDDNNSDPVFLGDNFPFMNTYLFYPNISKVSEWKALFEARNNTVSGEWTILIKDVDFGPLPNFTEYLLRDDGSIILRKISMVTHSPTGMKFKGNIADCENPDTQIFLNVFGDNRDDNYSFEPITLSERIYIPPETLLVLIVILVSPILLIVLLAKALKRRKKDDEFEEETSRILGEN